MSAAIPMIERPRSICIAGGTGFVGQELIYRLTRAGKKQLEFETADWTRRASAIARLLRQEG